MRKTTIKITRCLAATSLLIVFILDIITPVAFVVDILYSCCILLMFRENTRTIICFSITACLLIFAEVLFSNLKLIPDFSFWINRGMSILAIIITSYLAIRFRKSNQAGILKERQHLKALEEILFITSHRVRKPVANILGLIDLINQDNTILSADDVKKRCQYLCSSANEMDTIIKELNDFIEQTEQENPECYLIRPLLRNFPALENEPCAKLKIVV